MKQHQDEACQANIAKSVAEIALIEIHENHDSLNKQIGQFDELLDQLEATCAAHLATNPPVPNSPVQDKPLIEERGADTEFASNVRQLRDEGRRVTASLEDRLARLDRVTSRLRLP